MLRDIGFWNEQGEYIPDIQEVNEVEMKEYEHVKCPNCGYHWAVKEKDIIRCQFCMKTLIKEGEKWKIKNL